MKREMAVGKASTLASGSCSFYWLLTGAVLLTMTAVSTAWADAPVLRVEEDWQLVLNEPDDNVNSPQFHTVMSPLGDLDSFYAQVVWNYQETPEFLPGGLQLQSWNGEERIRTRGVGEIQLSTAAETITWTQSLETDGTMLLFRIQNGQSTTWGAFGKDMSIDAEASLPDLGAYSASVSAANSCITYGANRVNLLMITEVRRYGQDELISVDQTPRVVYQAPE